MLSATQARIIQMFSDLIFKPERHQYFLAGKQLPSVSSIVKSFVPPFDKDKFLPLSAAKASREEGREVTEHELERRWQLTNQTACHLGTQVHNFLENYTGVQIPTLPQEKAGIKYINSLKDTYRISFRELKAYSKKLWYAGTMDLPLEVIGATNETFVVADYKTNGDLFKAYDYMYPPFETMEASPYNAYQIQLSLYQIMLEEAGLYVYNRVLVHLKADESYKTYPLIDFTDLLRDYLKDKRN